MTHIRTLLEQVDLPQGQHADDRPRRADRTRAELVFWGDVNSVTDPKLGERGMIVVGDDIVADVSVYQLDMVRAMVEAYNRLSPDARC